MKNKEFLNIINSLIKENNIEIKRIRKTNSGRAFFKSRQIEIPEPTNIDKFLTCLHEIGHIVNDKSSNPLWKSEFIATKFANDYCKKYNIKIPEKSERHIKIYVKSCICKGLVRNLNIDNVDDEILTYAQIDKKYWKKLLNSGFRPFVYRDTGNINWYKKQKYNSNENKTF